MSIASLTAQPKPLKVTIAGEERTYLIYPLTIDDLGQLQSWVDSQFPDPFAIVGAAIDKGNYTVPQQQYLMERALALASQPNHLIGSPEADRVLFTLPGHCELLKLAIRKGGVEFSDDEAKELYLHLSLADLVAVANQTGIAEVASDPKASDATSSGIGNSASRPRRRAAMTSGRSGTKR
jgi:hypothetical protein